MPSPRQRRSPKRPGDSDDEAPRKKIQKGPSKPKPVKTGGKPGGAKASPAKASPHAHARAVKAAKDVAAKSAAAAAEAAAMAPPVDESDVVRRVSKIMKVNKLSQVQVGQEARVSQAVISQWLARKYHGHNEKVDQAMEDWIVARQNGTLHALVAPLMKDANVSVLRPSHHKAPPKKKPAPQMSKAQIQEAIEESATGLTFSSQGEEEDSSGPSSAGKRNRKRPPQLTDAMGEIERNCRAEMRSTRGMGRLISPSEFAPVNTLGGAQPHRRLPPCPVHS
jgi:hypothetical protein